MATCRDCGETILWFKMADTGRPIPVDADRILGGNIVLDGDTATVVKPDRGQMAYVTHYATCPKLRQRREAAAKARKNAKKANARKQLGLFDAPPPTTKATNDDANEPTATRDNGDPRAA